MERPDFESFIKVWMEDILNRGVHSTNARTWGTVSGMEDVLNRGVHSTPSLFLRNPRWMEDVLNRGVSSTAGMDGYNYAWMEDVLNRGTDIKDCMGVDGGIKNHYLYLLEKSFYDDFQNKVDERVIEHIFNTTEK